VSIIIKETIVGCGDKWNIQEILDRQEWLMKNLKEYSYDVWYGGLDSDDRYTRFENEEDAVAYRLIWM